MGFECALAVVLPFEGTVTECHRNVSAQGFDSFWDEYDNVPVLATVWRVVKYLDFGRVREVDKDNSSLSPEERAGGDPVKRAAVCTASFLLRYVYELERRVQDGDISFVPPLIADPILALPRASCADQVRTRWMFSDIFRQRGSRDVVRGLWASRGNDMRSRLTEEELQAEAEGSIYHRYNHALLEKPSCEAPFNVDMGNSLLWVDAADVAREMSLILETEFDEGVFLRQFPVSVALLTTWIDTLNTLGKCGAKVIFLTDYFYMASVSAMRKQERFL